MITSKAIYEGNLRCSATHLKSGEVILTDAPVDNQGKGEAFSPTDLAATSLGVCAITTIGIAANGRNIKIEGMEADITKIMASAPRRIAEIIIELRIKANLTGEQKEIIEEIGRNCPVARSLHPDVKQEMTFKYI